MKIDDSTRTTILIAFFGTCLLAIIAYITISVYMMLSYSAPPTTVVYKELRCVKDTCSTHFHNISKADEDNWYNIVIGSAFNHQLEVKADVHIKEITYSPYDDLKVWKQNNLNVSDIILHYNRLDYETRN